MSKPIKEPIKDVEHTLLLIKACGPVSLGSVVHELKLIAEANSESLDNSLNWEERAQKAIDTLVARGEAERYDDTDLVWY